MSRYMGQIMAECDCQHPACAMRGICMAARIEQLVAINEELIEEGSVMAQKLDAVEANLRELFQLLDKTEVTDNGDTFKPNVLRSCRALDAEKLSKILAQLKNMVEHPEELEEKEELLEVGRGSIIKAMTNNTKGNNT